MKLVCQLSLAQNQARYLIIFMFLIWIFSMEREKIFRYCPLKLKCFKLLWLTVGYFCWFFKTKGIPLSYDTVLGLWVLIHSGTLLYSFSLLFIRIWIMGSFRIRAHLRQNQIQMDQQWMKSQTQLGQLTPKETAQCLSIYFMVNLYPKLLVQHVIRYSVTRICKKV